MVLLTNTIKKDLEKYPLYSQDGKGDDAKVICKFFLSNLTWYVLEGQAINNGQDFEFFGIVDNSGEKEYGYFTLNQLLSLRSMGCLKVERDMYFDKCKVSELN